MKASMCSLSCSTDVNEVPVNDWPCRIENQPSTWFSQDARVGLYMECHERVARQPIFVLLMGVKIVEDDLEPGLGIGSNDFIHEVEELFAATALLVCCLDLASRHLEGREQRRRAVALVIVAVSRQRASVRQLQIALGTLERLDRGAYSAASAQISAVALLGVPKRIAVLIRSNFKR